MANTFAYHIASDTVGAGTTDPRTCNSCREHAYTECATAYCPVGRTAIAATNVNANKNKENEVTQYD
jgi:hypothetical protein